MTRILCHPHGVCLNCFSWQVADPLCPSGHYCACEDADHFGHCLAGDHQACAHETRTGPPCSEHQTSNIKNQK